MCRTGSTVHNMNYGFLICISLTGLSFLSSITVAEESRCLSEVSSSSALLQVGQKIHEELQVLQEIEDRSKSSMQRGLIASLKQQDKKKRRWGCVCKSAVETSTNICFKHAVDFYQKKYPRHWQGRTLPGLPQNAISLDFELETGARLSMTPELLLLRGGWDISQGHGDPFPKNVSKWFTVGLDGVGRSQQGTYQQQVGAMVELSSIPMRPHDVSAFIHDLQQYLHSINNMQRATLLPGSRRIFFKKSRDYQAPCKNCHLQWSVGLPLGRVPALLRLSDHHILKLIMKRLDTLCQQRSGGCLPEYEGLVAMAAWVLRAARNCQTCTNPKRCMRPWLVRTHFGDLVKLVRQVHGAKALQTFVGDVFQLISFDDPDAPIFLNGFHDYMHFAEMAEISGIVVPRITDDPLTKRNSGLCMPTNPRRLRLLAQQMLHRRYMVNRHLHIRKCAVYGVASEDSEMLRFSARDWLQAMLHGRDIMSDSDSPVTKRSMSQLVWKSMGAWRLDANQGAGIRVFLECRSPMHCIRGTQETYGPVPKLHHIARTMEAFEKDDLS